MNNLLPTIKQATTNDLQVLRDLSISTFIASYALHNTPVNMQLYIEQYFSISNLHEELTDTNNHFAIVHIQDEAAGYLKLRQGLKPDELSDAKALEIERIYVAQKYQGQKLGAALMNYCIDYALNNNYDTLWLGVWEHNTKAKIFYNKWDFGVFGDHPFLLGKDSQTDILLKKSLVPKPKT